MRALYLLSEPLPRQIAFLLVPIVYGVWISTAGYVVPYKSMSTLFTLFYWTNPLQVRCA